VQAVLVKQASHSKSGESRGQREGGHPKASLLKIRIEEDFFQALKDTLKRKNNNEVNELQLIN